MLTKKLVYLNQVRTDFSQMRVRCNMAYVNSYADLMEGGTDMGEPVLFFDGEYYWIGDGFHRIYAALKLLIKRLICEIRAGTKMDAAMYNIKANAGTRGLPMTNGDKRKSLVFLLSVNKATKSWDTSRLADYVGCNISYVNAIRQELSNLGVETPEYVEKIDGTQRKLRKPKPPAAGSRHKAGKLFKADSHEELVAIDEMRERVIKSEIKKDKELKMLVTELATNGEAQSCPNCKCKLIVVEGKIRRPGR